METRDLCGKPLFSYTSAIRQGRFAFWRCVRRNYSVTSGVKMNVSSATREYLPAIGVVAGLFAAANVVHFYRPATCFDCFFPYGVPFTMYHEGGFAGGAGYEPRGIAAAVLLVVILGIVAGYFSKPLRRLLSAPFWPYTLASLIAVVCWYGWTIDTVTFGGDVMLYGLVGRIAGFLSFPVTRGKTFFPPQHPLIAAMLVWLLWFLPLRVVAAIVRRQKFATTS